MDVQIVNMLPTAFHLDTNTCWHQLHKLEVATPFEITSTAANAELRDAWATPVRRCGLQKMHDNVLDLCSLGCLLDVVDCRNRKLLYKWHFIELVSVLKLLNVDGIHDLLNHWLTLMLNSSTL